MMFVYHYVTIPFHPQYLPRHAPQGGGIQRGGIRWPETHKFSLLLTNAVDCCVTHTVNLGYNIQKFFPETYENILMHPQ